MEATVRQPDRGSLRLIFQDAHPRHQPASPAPFCSAPTAPSLPLPFSISPLKACVRREAHAQRDHHMRMTPGHPTSCGQLWSDLQSLDPIIRTSLSLPKSLSGSQSRDDRRPQRELRDRDLGRKMRQARRQGVLVIRKRV